MRTRLIGVQGVFRSWFVARLLMNKDQHFKKDLQLRMRLFEAESVWTKQRLCSANDQTVLHED